MASESTQGPEYRRSLDGTGVLRISGLATSEKEIRVGTWNVRSLFEAGKIDNLELEMERNRVDILGISEMRWPGSGTCVREKTVTYYSGSSASSHYNGVGVMIKKELMSAVTNFVPLTDRVMLLQLKAKPLNINFLQVYFPTSDASDEDVEAVYEDIHTLERALKKQDVNIFLGDFNAKVGAGPVAGVVGRFGLGVRNDRGDRLVEFCQDSGLVVTNTWFKLPKRRLYTWVSPLDAPGRIVRNQVDFVMINKRFRNAVRYAKTYPGADVNSDHSLLVVGLQVRLRRAATPTARKVNLRLLKVQEVEQKVSERINSSVMELDVSTVDNVDHAWSGFKDAINSVAKEHLGELAQHKQEWMTDAILELMGERRMQRKRSPEYRALQTRIRASIRNAKEAWFTAQCVEVERLKELHDDFNLHKKIQELTRTGRKSLPSVIVNGSGQVVVSKEEKLKVWEEYVEGLFSDQRTAVNLSPREDYEGPAILEDEVAHAIRTAKCGKAVGPDRVSMELLKLMDGGSLAKLTQFLNHVYDTGEIPEEWLNSIFVTLPKKPNARKCSEHRTVSLMSHGLKVLLRVVHSRLWRKVESEIGDSQFGFRGGFGTREALFSLQVLVQKCLDQQCDVFACFIDFEKAFDTVKHDTLVQILERTGLDYKDIRLIKNLYWNQTAQVRVDGSLSDRVSIQKGVRQGCTLSPLLFNLYSEHVFREALDDCRTGIPVNGIPISNLRYADDTVLLAHTAEELQSILDLVVQACERYGLRLNVGKTKAMSVSKTGRKPCTLVVGTQHIEQVARFKYLGQWLTEEWALRDELRARIEVARGAFNNMKRVLCSRDLSFALRWRMVQCYIFSTVLYGVESWTLKAADMNRLEAFEMWLIRRMLKIPWTARLRNDFILQSNGLTRELLHTVKIRKVAYLGHIMRNPKYQLLQSIMMGKISGRRGVGRKRASWLLNIRQWTGVPRAADLFQLARDRDRFGEVIANLR